MMQTQGQMQGLQLWPSMIFFRSWTEYEVYKDSLVRSIRSLKIKQTEMIESRIATSAKSSDGLYEGNFDLFRSDLPDISVLVEFIRSSLKLAVSVAHGEAIQPQELAVNFVDSWYHVSTSGGFHDAHWHQNCSWCGIFYLEIGDYQPTNSSAPNGGSRFYSPIPLGGVYKDAGNRYMHPYYDPDLQNGMLLIFPSHLLHSGLPYFGSTERIVIAFNAQVLMRSQARSS